MDNMAGVKCWNLSFILLLPVFSSDGVGYLGQLLYPEETFSMTKMKYGK